MKGCVSMRILCFVFIHIKKLLGVITTKNLLYLHEAMIWILKEQPEFTARIDVLSDEIFGEGLYTKHDGLKAKAFQIKLRARNYPHLFELIDDRVKLVKEAQSKSSLIYKNIEHKLNKSNS
jgi:hypothetical protein